MHSCHEGDPAYRQAGGDGKKEVETMTSGQRGKRARHSLTYSKKESTNLIMCELCN